MDLREIEIFLTLADELHFGRTAERLDLSQSRVSRVIRAVERQVGGRLFDRTSRVVRLTPLGSRVEAELRPAYDALRSAVRRVRNAAAAEPEQLRIGLWSLVSAGSRLTEMIEEFRRRHPERQVELVGTAGIAQREALADGRLDLLVLWLPVDLPEIVVGPVLSVQQRMVGMSTQHPLAARDQVTVEDLADHAVVSFGGVPEASLYALAPRETPGGRAIPRGPQVQDTTELRSVVALGDALHATVESTAVLAAHPEITYRPLVGLPPVRSALTWHRDNRSPAARAFLSLAEEFDGDRAES